MGPSNSTGLEGRVTLLENNFSALNRAFEINSNVFVEAFDKTDAWVYVLQRVLNDVVKGKVEVTYIDDVPDGENAVDYLAVNYEWYFRQYWGCYGFVAFVVGLLKGLKEKHPEENGMVVFGGDDV